MCLVAASTPGVGRGACGLTVTRGAGRETSVCRGGYHGDDYCQDAG